MQINSKDAKNFNLKTYQDSQLRPVAHDPENMMEFILNQLTQIEILMNRPRGGDNPAQIVNMLGAASNCLLILGHLDEAQEYLEVALNMIGESELGVRTWVSQSLRLAEVLTYQQNWEESHELCEDLLEICQHHPEAKTFEDFAWHTLGKLHFDQGELQPATTCFQKALKLREEKLAQIKFDLATGKTEGARVDDIDGDSHVTNPIVAAATELVEISKFALKISSSNLSQLKNVNPLTELE